MSEQSADTDLGGFVRILASGWKTIAAVVIAFVGASLVLDLGVRTPVYTSETSVIITPGSNEGATASLTDDSARAMRNELEVAKSRPVVDQVEAAFPDAEIDVALEEDRDILRFTAADPDPEMAAAISSLFANAYLDVREGAILDDFVRSAEAVQTRITEIDEALDELGTESLTSAEIAERDVLVGQRSLLVQRVDDLALSSELARAGTARILSPANVAEDPSSPVPVRNAVLALVVGAILGVGLTYLLDVLRGDDRRRASVDRALGSLPVLGEIPKTKGKRGDLAVAALRSPMSPLVEAYRTVRTSLEFTMKATNAQIIHVVSSRPADGKTTAVANLGMVMAEQGHRTLLIDADVRNPTLSGLFGLVATDRDLVGCVDGTSSIVEAVRGFEERPNLSILPSRTGARNGVAEMLGSRRFGEFLGELKDLFDVILIDSSPILAVADSLGVAAHADVIVLAVGAETDASDIDRALTVLAGVGLTPTGVIHNGVDRANDSRYGAYYGGEVKSQQPAMRLNFHSLPRLSEERRAEEMARREDAAESLRRGRAFPTSDVSRPVDQRADVARSANATVSNGRTRRQSAKAETNGTPSKHRDGQGERKAKPAGADADEAGGASNGNGSRFPRSAR